MKGKSILLLAAGIAGIAGIASVMSANADAKYEEPGWQSIKKDNEFEVRKYPRVIAASVTVTGGDSDKMANRAFGVLAGYIFGKNKSSKKIAMTVPVTQEVAPEKIAMTVPVTKTTSGKSMTMKFFMPSKYDLDTLPEPEDKRIEFEVIPACSYATIRFSGLTDEERVEREIKRLQGFVESNGFVTAGEPVLAVYNPPWTLPFLRRNEVWIQVKTETQGDD